MPKFTVPDRAALTSVSGTSLPFSDVRVMSVIEGISEVKYSVRAFRILTQSGHSADALVNHLVGAQEKRLLDRQLHCFRHCDGSVLLKTIKDRGHRELRGTETRGHSRFRSSTPVG
jgi:hypothetical protein